MAKIALLPYLRQGIDLKSGHWFKISPGLYRNCSPGLLQSC